MTNKWFLALCIALPCVVWTIVYQYAIADYGKFRNVVESDGKGYYAYLPAVWIEGDLSWNFFFKEGHQEQLSYFNKRFLTRHKDKYVLKTYCGEAILLSPFFLAGTLKAKLSGVPCLGYEPYMQALVHVAALFYLILGLYCWIRFLTLFALHRNAIQLSVLAIVFATNLFHYATVEVTMTHVYSFSMIACFLFCVKSLLVKFEFRFFIGCAISLAFIALLRPVNLVVLCIVPFIADTEDLRKLFTSGLRKLLLAVMVFALICSIQPILNYIQCGDLFPWSYGEEGFYWTKPAIGEVLFGFRKGLFIYTPVLVIVLLVMLFNWKLQKRLIFGVLAVAILSAYIISAWWSWYYGPGFGHRAFIDWFPIVFIPLAIGLHSMQLKLKKIIAASIGLCAALNLFQTYQYQTGIFEKEDMSAGGYQFIFLKADPAFRNILAGEHELHFLPFDHSIADTVMLFNGFNDSEVNEFTALPDVMVFDKEHLFSPVFSFVDSGFELRHRTMLQAKLRIRKLDKDPCRNASVVLTITDTLGNRVLYKAMRFRDYPDYQSKEAEYSVEQLIEPVEMTHAKVDVYVYNPDSSTFALDEFSVNFQSFKREIR